MEDYLSPREAPCAPINLYRKVKNEVFHHKNPEYFDTCSPSENTQRDNNNKCVTETNGNKDQKLGM